MKISIAQINYHIGNFERNKGLICDAIKKARAEKADLVIFSELCVPGYPPLDLLDRIDFIEKCSDTVKEIAGEMSVAADVLPELNKQVEEMIKKAVIRAKANGRRTLMAKDI